jgi:hypothetical protein
MKIICLAMNILKDINCVEKLHTLILQKKTGSPIALAQTLGISRVMLHILIDELSSLNMPVSYSRKYETFYYETEVKLNTRL